MKRAAPVLYREDGEEMPLPLAWVICGSCDGHGKSSAHLGAFTGSEWAEACHDDPDFAEEYMAGRYDRECEKCRGRGSVQEVDEEHMDPALLAEWHAQQQADAEIRAIERAERRMGA